MVGRSWFEYVFVRDCVFACMCASKFGKWVARAFGIWLISKRMGMVSVTEALRGGD